MILCLRSRTNIRCSARIVKQRRACPDGIEFVSELANEIILWENRSRSELVACTRFTMDGSEVYSLALRTKSRYNTSHILAEGRHHTPWSASCNSVATSSSASSSAFFLPAIIDNRTFMAMGPCEKNRTSTTPQKLLIQCKWTTCETLALKQRNENTNWGSNTLISKLRTNQLSKRKSVNTIWDGEKRRKFILSIKPTSSRRIHLRGKQKIDTNNWAKPKIPHQWHTCNQAH